MNRRVLPWLILFGVGPVMLTGCDYSSTAPRPLSTTSSSSPDSSFDSPDTDMKPVILESVINLIETAALKPGGANFEQATVKLNNYFEGTPPSAYLLSAPAREFVLKQYPGEFLKELERPTFELPDARHLEDCMLYHGIATRIGGTGDDLARVRRIFDWMVRQVQLVPPQTLAAPGIGQAQARPYDVLLRGMATEAGGSWSERGWLFVSLCRQLNLDAGLITFTPKEAKEPRPWVSAVLIDNKLYLFDHRIGMEIPSPDGKGVATLDDALNDPVVLDRLSLPGHANYQISRQELLESPGKIGILIDSSPGYLSPRMLMLQKNLLGKNQTVLFRDPAEQRDQFVRVLGSHAGEVALWNLPILVVNRLFHDAKFVQATQQTLFLFDSRFPLLYARIKQLRGEIPQAVTEYMDLRLRETPLQMDRKTPIPPEIQQALDYYATYFLALSHLEMKNTKQAEVFFNLALKILPEPAPNQPFFNMFRWGAQTNLARLLEERNLAATAIAYYAEAIPTPQYFSNLIHARELIWRNPMGAPSFPLPPAPRPVYAEPEPLINSFGGDPTKP